MRPSGSPSARVRPAPGDIRLWSHADFAFPLPDGHRYPLAKYPLLRDRVLADGLAAAESAGVTGKDVTPFLLDFLARETGGESLEANVRLVVRNAGLAAQIAAELSA